jgi:Family of unknown function (DUF6535)
LRWHLDDLIAWVPLLLHIALTIFLLGIVLWLHTLHRALFHSGDDPSTLGATIYGIFAIIPVFATNAPFQWPISNLLQAIIDTARQFGRSTIARLHRAKTNNTKNFDLEIGGPVVPQYLLTPRLEDALLPILPEKPQRQFIGAQSTLNWQSLSIVCLPQSSEDNVRVQLLVIPDRKGRSSRPYPGTTLKISAVCLYLFVQLSMSPEEFF